MVCRLLYNFEKLEFSVRIRKPETATKVGMFRNRQEDRKMKKELLSTPEAAEILSCSTRTVRRLIEERTIEACKLRSSTRVVYTSLRKYVLTLITEYQEENGLAEFKSSN